MKAHVVPRSAGERAGMASGSLIQVLDLTRNPEHRPLWRSRGAASLAPTPAAGLPHGGQASPMGYWLAVASDPALVAPEALRIAIRPPGDGVSTAPDASGRSFSRPGGRPAQTVRVKAINTGDGDLFLTIGPGGAQVVASDAAWQTLAEPVLLAICQYFRFCAVDAEIDRITDLARGDLRHATLPSPRSLLDGKRLAENAEAVRALLVDLPHFEGVLTDPLPFCTSERSAQVYQSLSEKLHLEEWCEAIDERAEAIEDTYEAVTEKLFEYRNFAWEAILEAIIVVILLGELVLTLIDFFAA